MRHRSAAGPSYRLLTVVFLCGAFMGMPARSEAPDGLAGIWEPVNYGEHLSLSTGPPELGRNHRNLNLVIEGLRLLGDLAGHGSGLKQTFESLRHANDSEAVAAALLQMSSQLEASQASVDAFRSMRTKN